MVSILITAYNVASYITEAIDSAFNQDFQGEMEVIVVNDGSTDDTLIKIYENPKIHMINLIDHDNRGVSAAFNSAIMASKGEKIVILAGDDVLLPNFVSELYPWCCEDIGIVHTDYESFGDEVKGRELGISHNQDIGLYQMCARNGINSIAMYQRRAIVQCGGYNVRMDKGYEDWNLNLDIMKRGWRAKHIKGPLYRYRIRKDSYTGTVLKNHKEMLEMMKEIHKNLNMDLADKLVPIL